MQHVIHRIVCLFITVLCMNLPVVLGEVPVSWLEDGEKIISGLNSKKSLNIFCYQPKTTKSVLQFWQSVSLHIDIKDDNFNQHLGSTPAEVQLAYDENKSFWSTSLFGSKQKLRSLKLDIFNSSCVGIGSDQRYSVRLQVVHIDYRKVLTSLLGITLIILSKSLSENALFFYVCGISVGVSASLLVLVYFLSKLFPRKPLMYGMLAGGWAVGFYLLQIIYENINFYKTYLGWYCLVTGFISFIVCYKVGPPTDVRNKNLVMWTIQVLGSICLYFSSEYKEAAVGLTTLCLLFKYFPQSWWNMFTRYWHTKFPRVRRLLTDEEYFAEGAKETRSALNELREHCNSPDCAQWKTMLKLKEPKRFASFVEGESHLSDEEILDFESYAFTMENSIRRRNSSRLNNSRKVNGNSASRQSTPISNGPIRITRDYEDDYMMSSDGSSSSSSSSCTTCDDSDHNN